MVSQTWWDFNHTFKMVVGEINDLALEYENDEGGDGGASSGLADSGNSSFPNTISSLNTNVIFILFALLYYFAIFVLFVIFILFVFLYYFIIFLY